jgi:general nucleoside transport system ATP-binding protein
VTGGSPTEHLAGTDRITVLRRGKRIDTVPKEGSTEQSLARLMVGRDVLLQVEKKEPSTGNPVLELDDVRVLDDRELEAVRGVSLQVRAGEIVALAGVDGNGQHELVEAISGLRNTASGSIRIDGEEIGDRFERDYPGHAARRSE